MEVPGSVVSLPDEPLLQKLAEFEDPAAGITKEALLEHVRKQRADDPDVLDVVAFVRGLGGEKKGN